MLSQQDLKQLAQKGISEAQIERQLGEFKTGFPFLKLEAAAAIGRGIVAPNEAERKQYVSAWEQYKAAGRRVVKFVPASGAASRMFKDMFAFVDADYDLLSMQNWMLPVRKTKERVSRLSSQTVTIRLLQQTC